MIFKKLNFITAVCAISSLLFTATSLNASQIFSEESKEKPFNLITAEHEELHDHNVLAKIHKLAYTFPMAVNDFGDRLELFDESLWAINYPHARIVKTWVQEDIIFIKPRSSCFSRYNYVLYNFTSGEAVEAAFISMPRTYHYNKQQITKIDYYNGYIYLNDPNNTVWQVALSDNSYKSWQVGDFIIVGVNNNWRINSYPHILINCSITNGPYCEANLLLY